MCVGAERWVGTPSLYTLCEEDGERHKTTRQSFSCGEE